MAFGAYCSGSGRAERDKVEVCRLNALCVSVRTNLIAVQLSDFVRNPPFEREDVYAQSNLDAKYVLVQTRFLSTIC